MFARNCNLKDIVFFCNDVAPLIFMGVIELVTRLCNELNDLASKFWRGSSDKGGRNSLG